MISMDVQHFCCLMLPVKICQVTNGKCPMSVEEAVLDIRLSALLLNFCRVCTDIG